MNDVYTFLVPAVNIQDEVKKKKKKKKNKILNVDLQGWPTIPTRGIKNIFHSFFHLVLHQNLTKNKQNYSLTYSTVTNICFYLFQFMNLRDHIFVCEFADKLPKILIKNKKCKSNFKKEK